MCVPLASLLEGLADKRAQRTGKQQVRGFLEDIRDHDEAHIEAFLLADMLHGIDELRLEILTSFGSMTEIWLTMMR